MSGKRSRDKGARFERSCAEFFKRWYPKAKRGVGQSQSGDNGADVEGTDYWIEAKVGSRPNIQGAYDQAFEATDGRPILVFSKKDRNKVLVTMDADTFTNLIDIIKNK
tara:strand:- start:1144 stop:1467 length:324 start_codon:yes stop_codon:yes gene_type:complete